MVNAIRQDSGPSGPAARPISWIWLIFLGALGVCAMTLAYLYVDSFGLNAAILLGGVGLLSIMTGFIVWARMKRQAFAVDTLGLRDSYKLAVMHAQDPCVITRNGASVYANNAYFDLAQSLGVYGTSSAPAAVDSLFSQADKDVASAIFQMFHLDETGAQVQKTVSIPSDEGTLTYRITTTSFKSGQIWEIRDLNQDDRHRASQLANAPVGLFTVNQSGEVLGANDNLKSWVGAAEGLFPVHIREFIDDPRAILDSPKSPGRTVRADTRLITQRGLTTPVVMLASWQELGPDEFIANVALHGHSSLGLARPTPSRDRAKASPEAPERAAPREFSAAPIAFLELDDCRLSEARITDANSAFQKLIGEEAWRDRPIKDLLNSVEMGRDVLSVDARQLTSDDPFDAILGGADKNSVSVYLVANPLSNTCRAYLVDISARKALEDQLVQSQKMQAIGRLVAEIAHDFNNLLAAMRLYTDTLLGRHPIGDPSYPELQQINSNVNRAASLVKKLLAYSRKQTIRAVRLDVAETLSDIAVTLRQVLGERVNLTMVHGRDLPRIRVDKSQLDTVLMNLAVNARDAMKEQGGGDITIESKSLRAADVEDAGLRTVLEGIGPDRLVSIAVSDTGTGITDEIKSKIFDPFFTTKPQGEGTGLGLSTVYGIVQQSGGHLAVDSEIGVGTTFTIYLPEAVKGAEDEAESPPSQTGAAKPVRPPADLAGQGNILFVEDEDSVRVIAAKTLRKRGYNVVEACDGDEAYDILSETDTPFDLMISDVVMPGMDGPTLLKKGRTLLGDARIVFISGYAEEEFSDLLSEEPDVTFLPKPFTLIQLAEKVKSEIGESVS